MFTLKLKVTLFVLDHFSFFFLRGKWARSIWARLLSLTLLGKWPKLSFVFACYIGSGASGPGYSG